MRVLARSLAVLMLVAGCDGQPMVVPRKSAVLDSINIAGTYLVRVCRGSCTDTAHVLRTGYLVINPTRIDWSAAADSVQRVLQPLFDRRGNLCYAMETVRDRPETYAGLRGAGTTGWSIDFTHRRLILSLYSSPDADYVAVLVRTGSHDTLRGRGASRGQGSERIDTDALIAVRLGLPDVMRCSDAVLNEWKRRRGLTDAHTALRH